MSGMSWLWHHLPRAKDVNLDIDKYLNRIIPASQLHRLPPSISRFLGHRKTPRPDVGNVIVAFWALVGGFAGLVLVGAVFRYSSQLQHHNPPVMFASLGAAAVLEYNSVHSPLAQPRNAIVGHGISAVIGVVIAKLLQLSPNFQGTEWVSGSLACGLASAVMALTNTVHPPGGATAMLAVTDDSVIALGWFFVPMVLVGSLLLLAAALLINNIQRQFPLFWWTPREVGRTRAAQIDDLETLAGASERTLSGSAGSSGATAAIPSILFGSEMMVIPSDFVLESDEVAVLKAIASRLNPAQAGSISSYQSQQNFNHIKTSTAASPAEKAPNE